jgi:uncharacterized protein YndB with AHSA1/START domain
MESYTRPDVAFRATTEEQHMPDIAHLIKIRATPERVYQAIATADGIRNWWTRDVSLDDEVGSMGEFGFYGHRFAIKVRVAELVPSAHISWSNVSSTRGSFDGTTIVFDLKPDGNDTTLLFAHRGFKNADDEYASATTRWGYYLLSLKRYLETGKGSPNPHDTDL